MYAKWTLLFIGTLLILVGCEEYRGKDSKSIYTNARIDGKSCSSVLRQNRPETWPSSRTWMLCDKSNDLLYKYSGGRNYTVTVTNIKRRDRSTSAECGHVLHVGAGSNVFWFGQGNFGPITSAQVQYCQNRYTQILAATRIQLNKEKKESDEFKQQTKTALWVIAAVIFALFLFSKRIQLYTMFARHPAQDTVDRAIATGGRVATKELQSDLEKTSALIDNPPAPWKSKIMAEKTSALTKRLNEERRLAEQAIERDRAQQLRDLERKYGPKE